MNKSRPDRALDETNEGGLGLRVCYKEFMDRLIPAEKPTPVEKNAITLTDGVASEREPIEALADHRRE